MASFGFGRFPKCHRVFVGPRPWHIEIRHRVKKTSTINLFGFETLKLKIRRLKLWKPTVCLARRLTVSVRRHGIFRRCLAPRMSVRKASFGDALPQRDACRAYSLPRYLTRHGMSRVRVRVEVRVAAEVASKPLPSCMLTLNRPFETCYVASTD